MAIKLNRGDKKKTKKAILLVISGALFFIGLSRTQIIERIQAEGWMLMIIGMYLAYIALKEKF